MFQDPKWIWLEILVLVAIVVFFATLIGVYAYKKAHNIPTGECAACQAKSKRMLKEYRKKYGKTQN
jgi:hypothetical protein